MATSLPGRRALSSTRRRWHLHPLVIVSYVLVTLFCIYELIPLFYVIISSFKSNTEINRVTLLPARIILENYVNVLQNDLALSGFLNSVIIIVCALVIGVVVSSLAGYAISRGRGKIYTVIYLLFLSALTIPVATSLATTYTLFKNLGLLDTRTGLVLLYATGTIPFGVLLYTGFVKNIPRELDEAAMLDGCGFFGRFYHVALPLLRPVVIAHMVLSIIGIWNDFLAPLVYITSNDKKTLPLAMFSFFGNHATDWGAVFALLTLSMIPPLLFFLFAQKYIYQALTQGVIKG